MSDEDKPPQVDVPMAEMTGEMGSSSQRALYPRLAQAYSRLAEPFAEDRTKQSKEVDEKRDSTDVPKEGSINFDHLNLSFEECFHEHKSTRLHPKIHQVIGMVYQYTKLIVYYAFVLTLGILLTFIWAIINGLMAFIHTWIYNPALRVYLLVIWAAMPLITEPLKAIFKPLVDVSARIFSQIRVSANLGGGVQWYTHRQEKTV